ncbi:MAG: hypothetical protein QXV17_09135 [Candidatus Micrarchaeaceae archaeon]
MKETVILDVVEDRKGGVTPFSEEYQARVQEIFWNQNYNDGL